MAKQHKSLWIAALSISSGLLLNTAHAGVISGMYESINRAYTFRLDQKENVTPDRPYNPQEVYVPYYDEKMAQQWSKHYAGQPMQAVKGMDGSSRVMRPSGKPYDMDHDGIKTPYRYMPHQRTAYEQTPSGYQMTERRDAINWHQQQAGGRAQIYVGEPGSTPWHNQASSGRLGVKTQIGEATSNWKDEPGHLRFDARPGDYDYKPHGTKYYDRMVDATRLGQKHAGVDVARSSGYTEFGTTQQGGTDRYTVENGDTLSGISSKPKIYNDWKLWPLIHDANRSQINDPDFITPGQNLAIERGHSTSQKIDARRRATAKSAPHIYTDMR
ncbi:MAG: LysM peptidoglycan-binding domain-containing protein [Alphaproteobacteria bacterium]|nr:LysM peptidoglycan-binding domain-containing protein [Alphaproteobacteria bacterium]